MFDDESELAAIGWVDYVIILASLGVCVWIGLRKDKKQDKTTSQTEEFTTGSRNMSMLPVAFSLMATLLSGNSITGAIGEGYRYGLLTNFLPLSGLITKVVMGYLIVPIFHAIRYVSIYEYVELRFDRTFRLIFSGLYILSHLLYLGIALYSPSLSMATLSGIPYWVMVTALGLICAFYCALGGLKAIIWTDVFQSGLMFFCVLTIIVKGTWDAGGVGVVFDKSFGNSAANGVHLPLDEDPTYRYSLWAVLFAGVVDTLRTTVVSQAGAQRLLCVDSAKTARKSLVVGGVLMLFFKLLTSIAAMVIYANFESCDPVLMPDKTGVRTEDQMFIYSVSKTMSHIPGLQGLALAGLVSATLSTCSSYINAFAAITLEDFAKPFFPQWTRDDKMQVLICKLSTLVYALAAIALSFMTPYLGGVIKALMGVIASLTGPLCGVMLLGFFVKKTNLKACKIAFVVSLAFVLWITMGSLIYTKEDATLPSGLHGCPVFPVNLTELDVEDTQTVNYTLTDSPIVADNHSLASKLLDSVDSTDDPSGQQNVHVAEEPEYIFPLYLISFMWFGTIGMVLTFVLGIAISFIFGSQNCPDPRLLSPIVNRGWRWWRKDVPHTRYEGEECEPVKVVLLNPDTTVFIPQDNV